MIKRSSTAASWPCVPGSLVFQWSVSAAECFSGSLVGEVTYFWDGDTIERFEGNRRAGGD